MSLTLLHTPVQAASWLRDRVGRANARQVGQLTTDSRKVGAGGGFVAWPGAARDGRAFVPAALAQGAAACLVDAQGVESFGFGDAPYSEKIAAYAGPEGLKAASGPIGAAYYGQPSRTLDVLAITGTNGKTSTAWWLAQAISALRPSAGCGMIGTLGVGRVTQSVEDVVSTGLTTPDPVLLQRTLRRFADDGLSACAVEASSIGIVERRLDGTRIRTALFTNFTQDHLDYHGSMDAYGQAKEALFNWPELQAAVVNIDDAKGVGLAATLKARALDLWTYSLRADAGARLFARDIRMGAQGLRFDVVEGVDSGSGGQAVELQAQTLGAYNVSNLLGVIAALRTLGFDLLDAVAACRQLHPVPGRMEFFGGTEMSAAPGHPKQANAPSGGSAVHAVTSVGAMMSAAPGRPKQANAPSGGSEDTPVPSVGGDIALPLAVVDYAHTPDALAQILQALRPLATERGGQLWCLFGCGGDRDPVKRPLMGAAAARFADRVVLTSDNPRGESPAVIIEQIRQGLPEQVAASIEPDREQAIARTLAEAGAKDVVLVAGKGHEDYQETAGVRKPFSDREQVRLALRARQGVAA